jgi:predicted nucleic acid-binding protein
MTSSSESVTRVVADAYVVDTGVFLRWFIDQDGFEHARKLQRKLGLLAGRLTAEEFTAAVRVIDDIGVIVHETTADRLARAAALAAQKNLGIYDALFVQLARELDLPLLTTDLRLSRAGEGSARIDVLHGVKKPHPA